MPLSKLPFYSPVAARWATGFVLNSVAWGIAFGIAATAKMPPELATAMSALLFSGTAQLAAVQLWTHPVPATTILLAALSVNSRYLAMGATLAPLYAGATGKGLVGTSLLSDASWAIALRAAGEGQDHHSALLTCNALMWLGWVGGTLVGALSAYLVPELLLGALAWLVLALIATLLPPLVQSWKMAIAAGAAAVITVGIDPWLDGSWHVLVAGVLGAGIAYAIGGSD